MRATEAESNTVTVQRWEAAGMREAAFCGSVRRTGFFLHARRVLLQVELWWLAKSPIRVGYAIRAERGTELGGADSMEMARGEQAELGRT